MPRPSNDSVAWSATRQSALQALARRDFAAAETAIRRLDGLAGGIAGSADLRARANAELGDLCVLAGDYPAARGYYDQCVALAPKEPRHWFNRATVRRFLGDLEGAEQDYDACLRLAPGDAQAHLNRSELRVQSIERNHLPELERALASAPADWRARVPLHYALAKEYEDLGEFSRAWSQLTAGATLRRRHLEYDVRRDMTTMEAIRAAFPAEPNGPGGAASHEPIFILGMPRTGSTLVDRMLGSHPQVHSAGELPDFGLAVVAAVTHRQRGPVARDALIAESAKLDFAALGDAYLARTRPRTGRTPFFTDKLPLNFLYCGLIARALPAAQMVHVIRGPIATCLSIYKVLFDRGYPFSYDLNELADYYAAYRRLMDHWKRVLPGRLIEIEYESLIARPEQEARRLFTALGIAFDPRCLAFERNPTPVATASAAQVRRPIYADSVASWRHYARELEPLATRLRAAGIEPEA
ncbi:MAG: sulfotransferase [Gammaproteobacteria bacterium]|nr:sulfotransferase [Gammaproteobacteria bacterium]